MQRVGLRHRFHHEVPTVTRPVLDHLLLEVRFVYVVAVRLMNDPSPSRGVGDHDQALTFNGGVEVLERADLHAASVAAAPAAVNATRRAAPAGGACRPPRGRRPALPPPRS